MYTHLLSFFSDALRVTAAESTYVSICLQISLCVCHKHCERMQGGGLAQCVSAAEVACASIRMQLPLWLSKCHNAVAGAGLSAETVATHVHSCASRKRKCSGAAPLSYLYASIILAGWFIL